jgi:hypothetical protein
MQVYYAQRDYHKKHKRWAKSLNELGAGWAKGVSAPIELLTTFSGFEAILCHEGKIWHVRHDSRLWAE